ncbi:synaptic plasticity regulator PANTS [Periplaneta americana]|uniref:synaptic plasticity regulator PANTS n=1 Tax=Periplaneta americana TaxID=6978 RepID=UPI0037E8A574
MPGPPEETEDTWMVRPCKIYKEEYNDCTSFKARFHQYFIFGETVDCSQWKRDFDSCVKWNTDNNPAALKELVESETERRRKRLEGHYKNTVWEKRSSPPRDWNKPLPDRLVKEYENTYLDHRAREMAGDKEGELQRTACVLC